MRVWARLGLAAALAFQATFAAQAPYSSDHDANLSATSGAGRRGPASEELGGVQGSPPSNDDRGVVGLGLALRRLKTVGSFMQATAHPDDEGALRTH